MKEFLNIELMYWEDFADLLVRFAFNLVVVLFMVRYLYYRTTRRKDYLFTYILISLVVFFMCFLLENIKLELGFALGLFAIFGIIRYRTQQIPIREMTYLFLIIGISVINALSNRKVSYAELVFTNLALLVMTYLLERVFLLQHESRKMINFEKIDLIVPERRAELIADLEERTGLKINRVEVDRIDFMRDTARIYIYYYESDNVIIYSEGDRGDSRNNDDDDD
ncbi:MAG: DUF4956 domain-containing protein [Bacteroidales bacterium]|nr:DUF4956 domain-containing protein [Bacteroidales bacterium]